jgi:hypothetical protein
VVVVEGGNVAVVAPSAAAEPFPVNACWVARPTRVIRCATFRPTAAPGFPGNPTPAAAVVEAGVVPFAFEGKPVFVSAANPLAVALLALSGGDAALDFAAAVAGVVEL